MPEQQIQWVRQFSSPTECFAYQSPNIYFPVVYRKLALASFKPVFRNNFGLAIERDAMMPLPTQMRKNPLIERFNDKLRIAGSDQHLFDNGIEAQLLGRLGE